MDYEFPHSGTISRLDYRIEGYDDFFTSQKERECLSRVLLFEYLPKALISIILVHYSPCCDLYIHANIHDQSLVIPVLTAYGGCVTNLNFIQGHKTSVMLSTDHSENLCLNIFTQLHTVPHLESQDSEDEN